MFDAVPWWGALEIERAKDLERGSPRGRPVNSPPWIERKLARLVARARRAGLTRAEIEMIVRWAVGHE
ncbi:MAG: hypothetical protein GXO72_03530 [Caldiserica bacterium]|nr:hypothetical protein [Caldisericota bacterium]